MLKTKVKKKPEVGEQFSFEIINNLKLTDVLVLSYIFLYVKVIFDL